MPNDPLEFDLVATPEPNLVPKMSARGAASMRAFKSGFFNREKVKKAMDEATHFALLSSGAWVRSVARRSMRYRKSPSRPGEPPSARQGPARSLLRRMLYFAYDAQGDEVVAGPVKLGQESGVPNLHEFGGIQGVIQRGKLRVGMTAAIRIVKGRRIEIGPHIKAAHKDTKGRRVVYAKLKTPGQVEQAHKVEDELYGFRDRRFPKRPYMRPALLQSADKIPTFWENSLGVKRRITV